MRIRRSIIFTILFIFIFSCLPAISFAGEQCPSAENSLIIEEIKPLSSDIASQTVSVRSGQKIQSPSELSVRLEGSTDFISLAVSWTPEPSSLGTKAGTYTCAAQLPAGYRLKDGVSLPEIRVNVQKSKTAVSGIPKRLTKKSRSSLTDSITVSPAYGRSVQLQMKQNGKWVTKKTYRLKNSAKASLNLSFPNDWWKVTSSSWRVVVPESAEGKAFSSSAITVKTKRYYQNPSKYIQIKDKITLRHSGNYKLRLGYMGLKVRKVNNYFHIGNKYWPRYTSQTKQKVKAFQRKKGLKATGVVNLKTWRAMGFSEKSWNTLGAYVSPIKVNPSSTKKQHIDAMINTAKKYLGSDYVVGASGKPSQGADCSGLIMQALYAAGVDPYPVSCVRHSKAGYEYESRNLWKNKKFKSVPYGKKKRGDLVFYRGNGGAIIHIAIYLGNGKVIESWPNKVVIWPIKNSHRSRVAGIKRVFI